MPRALAVAAVLVALVAPHASAIEAPPDCNQPLDYNPPNNITYMARPVVGKPWTLNANIDPQYVKPGSLTVTLAPDAGSPTTLTPSVPNADFTYTPKVAGNINVNAHWLTQNCADPVSYTDAYAAFNTDVDPAPKALPKRPSGGLFDVSLGELPDKAASLGFMVARKLPRGCNRGRIGLVVGRRLNVSPPGKPNPSGTWWQYPGSGCPQVGVYKASLSLVRSLLIAHMKDYVKLGGRGAVGHIKAGRFSVTTITQFQHATSGAQDLVWGAGGRTYDVTVLLRKNSTAIHGTSIKSFIGSFR